MTRRPHDTPAGHNPDIRNLRKFGLTEAVRMIETGEICDAKTVLLIQWLQLQRSRG